MACKQAQKSSKGFVNQLTSIAVEMHHDVDKVQNNMIYRHFN